MSASTHVIFRISNGLAGKLKAFGDGSLSESLQAKQMLILAVNNLDRRYLELVKYVVAAMEESQGRSVRSRQNDLLEPFERACDVIKSQVDAKLISDELMPHNPDENKSLDENKRAGHIYEFAKRLCQQYQFNAAVSGCIDFVKVKETDSADLSLKMLKRTINETRLHG